MSKKLVIVESPAKAHTIGKYLGSTYKVKASVGHVRDLPKSRLGIDIDNDFEPEYINIRGKGDLIKELKKEASEADKVFLATDPDREGESISWHLCQILGLDPKDPVRVTFNEITKDVIKEAIKSPRPIDQDLVDSQQARREVDRLVGYMVSPILWKKVKRGASGGRVQSAVLKLICDREKTIKDFVPQEYWNISVLFDTDPEFEGKVQLFKDEKLVVPNEEAANKVESDLNSGKYQVSSVTSKVKSVSPFNPFTTSTLQQDASIKLGFTTTKTMSVAQRLYEGINVPGRGTMGLITYMRTDSTRISEEAKKAAYAFIADNYGKEYTSGRNSAVSKNAQDAHEAIRPANVFILPDELKDLDKDQYKLYKLIWERFVASRMAPAKFDTKQVEIKNGDYTIKASGSKRIFDGFQKVYATNNDEERDKILPELNEGDVLENGQVKKEQKFTEPPQRYTEASLVKEMEQKNIGRPSTYASTVALLLDRKYISRMRGKKTLQPTDLGFTVIGFMETYFNDITDSGFTSQMEDKLDAIGGEGVNWKQVLRDFYGPFKAELDKATEAERIQQKDVPALDDKGNPILCDICQRPMLIKSGRFGDFMACSGFPECKNTKPILKSVGVKCPECGNDIVRRRGKSGKTFYGCSNYPKCKVSFWYKPVNKRCPKCQSLLVEKHLKNTKLACSNDKCDYKE
ncbi:MAG: type I DNA topoisomerase [Firmicutes bacterium]|nr:type I DNA topoisomerase [Bacillota bacterium]MBQ1630011.1 type I DNA topoisomerase [Bacillota bacterium]